MGTMQVLLQNSAKFRHRGSSIRFDVQIFKPTILMYAIGLARL